MTRTEDQLLVAFRVQGGLSSVVHALLPLAYEPVLASLLRTTVSTAAYHHSKQAMRESLANYSQSILGEFDQPTADLCASRYHGGRRHQLGGPDAVRLRPAPAAR